MVHNHEMKRNTPVATLLKNFADKKGGKVTASREEIQRRFDFLEWKDQKKIIPVFLDSGKTDRQWAYSKLLDLWDKSFQTKINALWEQLHEEKCTWVVIRHFPLKFLSQHLKEFSDGRNYYFACLRLALNKKFVIDKDRLSPTDYLALLYHTGRSVECSEAEALLFGVMHDLCLNCEFYFAFDRYVRIEKGNIVGPRDLRKIGLMLYYLDKLGCESVISHFDRWNGKVQQAIVTSREYQDACAESVTDVGYEQRMIDAIRKYAYLQLDERYRKPTDPSIEEMLKPKHRYDDEEWAEVQETPTVQQKTEPVQSQPASPEMVKEMIDSNPSLAKLIDSFGLDVNTENNLPF